MIALPGRGDAEYEHRTGSKTAESCGCSVTVGDSQTNANAALVGQSLEFLERFLTEITDGDSVGAGYAASGAIRAPAVGSLIEARG